MVALDYGCCYISVAVILVSIACYALYSFGSNLPGAEDQEMEELLLKEEEDTYREFLSLKYSADRYGSFKSYVKFAIFLLVVVGLYVVYYNISKGDVDSRQAKEMKREQAFIGMHDLSHTLQRELHVSEAEKHTKDIRYKDEKDSIIRRHEQEARQKEEYYRKRMTNLEETHEQEITKLQSELQKAQRECKRLQQECRGLEKEREREKGHGEELKAKLTLQAKDHEDKLIRQAKDYEREKQAREKQKKRLDRQTTQLRNDLDQLQQHSKVREEQDARDKRELNHR